MDIQWFGKYYFIDALVFLSPAISIYLLVFTLLIRDYIIETFTYVSWTFYCRVYLHETHLPVVNQHFYCTALHFLLWNLPHVNVSRVLLAIYLCTYIPIYTCIYLYLYPYMYSYTYICIVTVSMAIITEQVENKHCYSYWRWWRWWWW